MKDNLVKFKPSFTPQMEEMVRHARKTKPTGMLMALVDDDKVYVNWSSMNNSDLGFLRALIDNQIEMGLFEQNTRYGFCPPEFQDNSQGPDPDPKDIA